MEWAIQQRSFSHNRSFDIRDIAIKDWVGKGG
jgi:hypothetical protein